MVMARKKEKKEKDIIDQLLDNIDFKGLTHDEVVGQDGVATNPELIKKYIFRL